jgi:hypothetical protein
MQRSDQEKYGGQMSQLKLVCNLIAKLIIPLSDGWIMVFFAKLQLV